MEITLMRTKPVLQVTLKQRSNESRMPQDYHCNFLEPGIASYEDVGQGIALLKKETMDDWIQTFKNKPVVIEHQEVDERNFKQKAVGYITNVYYNAETGWYDCDFIITDDEGHKVIEDGWSVSCSFDVIEHDMTGGEWHANKYTEEILKGEGLHLALVTSPRYEDCRITRNNKTVRFNNKKSKINEQDLSLMSTMALDKYLGALSDVGLQTIIDGDHDEAIKKIAKLHQGDREKKKEEDLLKTAGDKKDNMVTITKKEDAKMWKFWKRKGDKVENDKIDAMKVFVDVEGEKVPLSTLMNSVTEDFELLQESDTVKINGKDVSIKDLVDKYKNSKGITTKVKSRQLTTEEATVFNSLPTKEKQQEFLRLINEDKKDDDEDKDKKDDCLHCRKCGKKLDDDDKKRDDEEKKKSDDGDEEVKNAYTKSHGLCNECWPKKDDDKGKKKDDDDDEDKGKEIKNKGKETKKSDREFFIDLENARHKPLENEETGGTGSAKTREDKAKDGKKFFGSKKKDK